MDKDKKKKITKKLPFFFAVILFAWSAFWLVWNAMTFSITSDEIVYITAGVRMLERGDTIINSEHPPLNKILSGLFEMPLHINIDKAIKEVPNNDQWEFGDNVLFESGNPRNLMIFLGRLPTVLVTLLLLVMIWLWMAKYIHPWAAVGAVASLALNPNILAHGALSTNDIHLALAVWLLFIASYNLIKDYKITTIIWFGLALGFMLLAKFSGLFFISIALLVVFVVLICNKKKILQIIGGGLLSIVICSFLIWGTYVIIERHALLSNQAIDVHIPRHGIIQIQNPLKKIIAVPLLRYKEGYNVVQTHNKIGHKAYLNGVFSMEGFKSFFIMCLWYKTPTALLLLIAIGFIWALVKKQWIIFLLGTVAIVFVVMASFGRIHIGIRHILPFYVLMAPAAGLAVWKIIESRIKLLYTFLVLVIVWWIADLALNGPNKISFFAQISGGWHAGYKHLSDSNTDWGQELTILSNWVKTHPNHRYIIGYATGENPLYRGVNYTNVTDIGMKVACHGLDNDQILIVSVNVAKGLFGAYPCIDEKISLAQRLGHTYLIFYPDNFTPK